MAVAGIGVPVGVRATELAAVGRSFPIPIVPIIAETELPILIGTGPKAGFETG